LDAFADGVAVKQVGLWNLVGNTCMVWHVCVSFVGLDACADGVAVKQVGLWSLVDHACMVWHVCVSFVG
jgi:hypothetical protein